MKEVRFINEEDIFITYLPNNDIEYLRDTFPFVPNAERKEERFREILHLQARGLSQRMKKIGIRKTIIGISGGLDNTLALLVSADSYEIIALPLKNIIAITMPGFGTSEKTKANSDKLMEFMGVTARTMMNTNDVYKVYKATSTGKNYC